MLLGGVLGWTAVFATSGSAPCMVSLYAATIEIRNVVGHSQHLEVGSIKRTREGAGADTLFSAAATSLLLDS